ncbi:hypothetical protein [Actinomadura parmotrematis]|uniref:ABC transporter permease n=1 Tax=Actinomadura parmotrematis TaxID=2864039 RepID=A0ABS7G2G0_9ACTN|nr:hypothetical protein [Actinomadura parmotrematis]MBW8486012.1 hypothetical protein [Actinomadura parmotrematis]
MIALVRFQIEGYLRSLRVLYPLIAVLALTTLVLAQPPSSSTLAFAALGDTVAFLVPLWAWTSRSLLNTQPPVQEALSSLAVRRHSEAGLLAAYLVNLVLGAVLFALPLSHALTLALPPSALLLVLALTVLACASATLLGAWTSRAVIPSPSISALTLLALLIVGLVLDLTPAAWLSLPVITWDSAAHRGPSTFRDAFPGLALHLVLWTIPVAAAYHLKTRRPR